MLRPSASGATDRSTATTPGARSEAGETLVEVLLALIILALASVALLTAFGTDISASAEHRRLSSFDTVLASSISMTTSVVQQQYAAVFSVCPSSVGSLSAYPSSTVLTAALDAPGYTAAIAPAGSQPAVEYLNGNSFSGTCDPKYVGNPQLINVVVTNSASGYSQDNSVVVVDPTAVPASGVKGTTATQLKFVTQPEGASVGTPFSTQPVLEVLDGSGNVVRTDLSPITLTILYGSGTNGASLSNTCAGVETSGVVVYSGCSINEVGTGYRLTASEPDPNGTGLLASTSTPFSVYSAQLNTPTISSVVPSTVAVGAINVTFAGSANAPSGQTYNIKACTDIAMSANCVTQTSFTSGNDLTGLVPGTSYYVQITAASSTPYLASTSRVGGPGMATAQLNAPGTPSLGYGPVAGSLTVSFAASTNAAPNQTYTAEACTNTAMSTGCVTNANFSSGGNLTGLSYVAGSAGATYYVQVTANAVAGYLASPASTQASHADTSQVKTPTGFSAASSASQQGAVTAAFTEPGGGTAPSSFTGTACTDAGMTAGCVVVTNYTSGAQLNGLTPGTNYFVTVTAVASSAGYVSTSTTVSSATLATVQLGAPTSVNVGFGTAAGSVAVTFAPPGTVAAGQSYTVKACTNTAMSAGCVANANYSSGADLTGLAYVAGSAGATYYVQVTANASTGYLVSPISTQVSHADTSQVGAPGAPTATSGARRSGAIVVTFSASPGTAPISYAATACTNRGMTNGCVTVTNYASGAQLTGLVSGTSYYVQITAVAPIGYVNNNSAVSTNSTSAG